ncbi:MAG TPA: glucoamylase family protein [Candidatus Dormibacteraeota bacterium]|nr:glucoamylase family protein [Candidatus Dormibacteraeota bacterium]
MKVPIGKSAEDLPSATARPAVIVWDEKQRSTGLRVAQSWRVAEPDDVSEPFSKRLAIASTRIGQIADRLQQAVSSGARLQGDAVVVIGNLMVIRSAVRECRQALRAKSILPLVEREDGGAPVPRVYAAVIGYLNTSDDVFDEFRFPLFAEAVQEESPFQMKELWNLKPYLEFALLERIAESIEHLERQTTSRFAKNPARLRRCTESLRRVLELDWKKLFEQIDETDKILQTDPLRVYGRMDFESRDAYRAAVGDMAAHSRYSEQEVAQAAIVLARQAQRSSGGNGRAKERRTHVGFYLIGPAQKILKQQIGYRASFWEKVRGVAVNSPDYFYFVSLEMVAVALMVGAIAGLHSRPPAAWVLILFLLAAAECAVAITNSLVTTLLPPKKLPKVDFSKGIANGCATMVVVPTLLSSEAQVKRAVKDLEVRFLGNRDRNLHFALLTDPADSNQQFDEKDGLTGFCSELIEQLNKKYSGKKNGSFFHFYRPRVFNSRENIWMGWERKRGKLLQFNRLLLGQEDAFPVKTGDLSILSSIRYVITLDADTQLPAGAAHRMVGAIAHPLNSAVVDARSNTVVEGYGILQPRVEISLDSARRSRLASLFSGETGLDIYTRAVSDVYQDLFGEAIFSGKGIYEVSTFEKVLDGRLPNDSILSHDLIESAYARAGLLSDVEVIDDYPTTFSALNRRKHRWIRGDWQISPWLLPRVRDAFGRVVRNPISHVSRWKILDNLRRSVTDIALLAALLFAWLAVPQAAVECTLVVVGVLLLPVYLRIGTSVIFAGRDLLSSHFWEALLSDWASSHARIFFRLAFLCHQGLLAMDAVVRTLTRMNVTHRRMLEWETAADSESDTRSEHIVDTYVRASAFVSAGLGILLAIFHPAVLAVALPFLLLWMALPKITQWLDQPSHSGQPVLDADEQAVVRNAGLRTWRFFREFSTADENWLVPDLMQQTPPVVAHRISTTNLGLLLNARLAAYDLGYLTPGEFAEQSERTFESIRRMPKFNGQLYNWYSTHTLEPDHPLFVSTVDNGNLLCSLWTLKEGCGEIINRPLHRPEAWQAIVDHVNLLGEAIAEEPESEELVAAIRDLRQRVQSLAHAKLDGFETFATLEVDTAIFLEKLAECSAGEEVRWWTGELRCRVKQLVTMVSDTAPWLRPEYAVVRDLLEPTSLPKISDLNLENISTTYGTLKIAVRSLIDNDSGLSRPVQAAAERLLDDLDRSRAIAKQLRISLLHVADQAESVADEMDFSIFFDEKREMLSIGYDVSEGAISKWHYDLLPSEARSAAFGGIAQGSIPHKVWFRLGRFHGTNNRQPMLYSWSGTMFEYLMPCLWTKAYKNSLLERSARAAIRVQQKFAEEKGNIPWGVSECACNEYNPDGHYVYHAFGVPQLALHRDEFSNDVVIAPYATFLAMMLDPVAAVRNVVKMKQLGWLGEYGFYDAVDFTARRIVAGKQHEVVRTWMAHHQGMTLVAISNTLCDSAMQRRFHADPRVAAAERVLHEMPPRAVPAWDQEIVANFCPADSNSPADAAQSAA